MSVGMHVDYRNYTLASALIAATRASSDSFSLSGMATPQISSILPTTDSQLPRSSSATLIEDMTLNSASIYPQSHPRSPLSTAISNSTQTIEQHAPTGMGPMSSSIHNGANLILDLIRKERQQALEVGQRQIAHIQQQHNEYCASYSKVVREESTKRRDAEEKILYLTGELAKYTNGPTEAQNIALQAKADATAARNTASEAERAAAEARSHLAAVQDALQKFGITVSRDDSVTSDTLKIILGTPWLELIPSQIHSPHLPLPDSSSAPVDKPSSSPPHHLGSPSKFITFIKEHINHLSDTLTASQNSYKDLDSQCNQLQNDLCTLRLDRNELESLKKETEDNAKMLDQWKSKLEKLEIEIKLLKVERDDAVKAQEEAATALEEMRRTSAASAVALTSTFDQRLEDQQHQAEMNLQKSCQALENSIEAKTVKIRDLQSRLAQITANVDEWEGKYDAVTRERDSQKQLLVAERQKYTEASSVQKEQIDNLQKQLKASVSEEVMMAKVTRIEELEKELASIRAHHAKSSQEKDEAISLVKSRDAQIKELHEKLAVHSSRNLTTECAPKTNSGGNSEQKKARPSKSSTTRDQIQSKASEARPVATSTGDQRSKQIIGLKKTKSSSTTLPSFAARPIEVDSASSTDVEIISGPIPVVSQGSNTKQKPLRTGSNKKPLGVNTVQTVDSPTEKTNLKRAADTDESSTPATKRPKLFLDSSASSVEKVSSAVSSSPVSTPLGSRSATSSPVIAKPVFNLKFTKNSSQASTSVPSGGAMVSKATASSSNVRRYASMTSSEAPSTGTSDSSSRRRSGSITSEAEPAAESTLGTKPRARFLRHGQTKPASSTASTSSKNHAEFKNFNPGDVPAKEQPSGSSARSTAVSVEQSRNAQAAASATASPSKEASSSASAKSKPSVLRQFSGIDNLSTPRFNSNSSSSLPTASGSTVDRSKATSSRNTTLKGTTWPAGTRPIPSGPRSSMAMLQVTPESPPQAPKSVLATKPSGKVPQRPRATIGTSNTKKST